MKLRNMLMHVIRCYLSNAIIYHSAFVKDWSEAEAGKTHHYEYMIHNGVSLKEFSPSGTQCSRIRLVCAERNLNYFPHAADLLNHLAASLASEPFFGGIYIYGGATDPSFKCTISPGIVYGGEVPRAKMATVYPK